MGKRASSLVIVSAVAQLVFGTVSPGWALQPELAIPEKVSSTQRACQELMRLGKKYRVTGMFSKEFEQGSCQLTRLDVAVAVQLLTERIAEEAAKDGASAVDKEDLLLLSDLREELRTEMMLAQARAFQNRYTELGTNLHALTRNITMSGGLTGVLQGSFDNKPKDSIDAVGRADLVFNFKLGESTIAVIDVESTGGSGIDPHVANYSILNNVPLAPTDTVRFRTAWVEQTLFGDRLVLTVGKIGLTDYFDANNVANNENSQFLAGAFVNSPVLGAPGYGPGIRVTARPSEKVSLSLGYGSGDGSSDNLFDHGYGIAELDYRLTFANREGTYRAYGSLDGAVPAGTKLSQATAWGAGINFDQQLSERLTIFGRFGWHDKDVYAIRSAWSAGLQYQGIAPWRQDDLLGVAYGQILVNGASAQERLLETYYRVKANEQIAVSPHLQYLINPLAEKNADNVLVAGLRVQVIF